MKNTENHAEHYRIRLATIIFAVLPFLFSVAALLFFYTAATAAPGLNHGKKWRIGYYEGGPYSDYTDTMRTLIQGLADLGWITAARLPEYSGEMQRPYWQWLSQTRHPFLNFRPEDAYCADWDRQERDRIKSALLQRLKNRELDLVIAMGTWAGQDLATSGHRVPTIVVSASDPIRAGIVKNEQDSGLDHVTARVDRSRFSRQIRMFHRIVKFKRLGVAYEDTHDGRIYSAVDQIHAIAAERGFDVVACKVQDTTSDISASDASCLACYQKLAKTADAVYVTELACADRNERLIADLFRKAQVPTFAMVGSKFVKKGMMLSLSDGAGYRAIGRYNAHKIDAILNGTLPRQLDQTFEDPLEVAVNMETVRQIKFSLPGSLLRIASEVYEK